MVNRVIPKENRRLALIHLTNTGKQVCSAINYSSDSYVREMLDDFTEDGKLEFLKLFRELTSNMAAHRAKEKKLP
jgi:DNA-binding MarR family transcriptional regulator